MRITKVGNRGTLFTFYELGIATNVYTICGKYCVYIIDTYLGPDIMKKINQYLEEVYGNKPFIVINSHSHWDHIWGNCLYGGSLILAHENCKKHIEFEGQKMLERYDEHKKGEVIITYPNLLFSDKIHFDEDKILVLYTPGHTNDSISVLDMADNVLFAGDNLERPIPYLMSKDLTQYIKTLENYLGCEADIIIGGHTECEGKGLVLDNLDYLKRVLLNDFFENESSEFNKLHKINVNWLNH